jgi:excinuclease ABC subunit B
MVPGYSEDGLRIEFFGDEVERITRFETLTGDRIENLEATVIFPARHYVTPHEKLRKGITVIQEELAGRIAEFEKAGKYLEAQRIKMRTTYDIDMMQEMGFCSGIENYSRPLSGRPPGSRPGTLIDFFPEDFLTVIDESHATVPQIGGMYAGDRSRKTVLVEHGFRLPSALDNRPLNFAEFEEIVGQRIYVSATPGKYELEHANGGVIELVIRPTGLLDPKISVRPLAGQIDEVIKESNERAKRGERILVTTLTKRTAEDLTEYLKAAGLKVQYIHSEVDAIERVEILRALRAGEFDVLVGINLLREGLDLPEVSLVAVLDADKEGYLRSETSLIQTAGRAARHANGEVILFADVMTKSMRKLIEVTQARRDRQMAYNEQHGIIPRTVVRGIQESLGTIVRGREGKTPVAVNEDVALTITQLEQEMIEAAENLEYEKAALLRDQINELKGVTGTAKPVEMPKGKAKKALYKKK